MSSAPTHVGSSTSTGPSKRHSWEYADYGCPMLHNITESDPPVDRHSGASFSTGHSLAVSINRSPCYVADGSRSLTEEEEGLSSYASSPDENSTGVDGVESGYTHAEDAEFGVDDADVVLTAASSSTNKVDGKEKPNSGGRGSVLNEIREALEAYTPECGSPFLNMAWQRDELEKKQYLRHLEYICTMNEQSTFSRNDLLISSKLLLHEAHRLQYLCTAGMPHERHVVGARWRRIKQLVEQDMDLHDHTFIQRRLSCMCLFNPRVLDTPYSDNEEYREQRTARQQEIIHRLQEQVKLGSNSHFLEN